MLEGLEDIIRGVLVGAVMLYLIIVVLQYVFSSGLAIGPGEPYYSVQQLLISNAKAALLLIIGAPTGVIALRAWFQSGF
jgi:hypothetical protein